MVRAGRSVETRKLGLARTSLTLFAVFLASCRVGGELSAGLEDVPNPVPIVTVPTVATPTKNPYYSRESEIEIRGQCGLEHTVVIDGSEQASFPCSADATYSYKIARATDGVYSFLITQIDADNVVSKPASFVWVRKSSVGPPTLTTPTTPEFASGLPTFQIAGTCETGSTISLDGDGFGETTCLNSTFSISFARPADGDYDIVVNQTDLAGNSSSVPVRWKKRALTVSPTTATMVVRSTRTLIVTGGSESYDLEIETNNSGGVLDPVLRTYRAGPLANVTDVIRVTDSLDVTEFVTVTTIAGSADHIKYVSGDQQFADVGGEFALPLRVQVVDENDNGIPAVPVAFFVASGEASFVGPSRIVSDANGFAQVRVRQGLQSTGARIRAAAADVTLPADAVGSTPYYDFTTTAQAEGRGTMGLNFQIGQNPRAIARGDFNNDGKNDIAVLNAQTRQVGILIGRGDGLFADMVNYVLDPTCNDPRDLAVGDFTNDTPARLDIVVACNGSDSISRLQGDGVGAFTMVGATTLDFGPATIFARDFNADGNLDIAAVSDTTHNIEVRDGDGDFDFGTQRSYPIVALGAPSPKAAVLADIDNDSRVDLLVVDTGQNALFVLRGLAGGAFGAATQYATGTGPNAVAAGDLDADGFRDVVVTNGVDDTLAVFRNDATGLLLLPDFVPVQDEPSVVRVDDFDLDGDNDVIVSHLGASTINLLPGDGAGTLGDVVELATKLGPLDFELGNFNGDSFPDLVISAGSETTLQVIPGDVGGAFGLSYSPGTTVSAIASGDFNGDGIDDQVVVTPSVSRAIVLRGRGNGRFVQEASIATGALPVAVLVRDIDADEKLDFVTVNQTDSTVSVYLGNGDFTFDARTNWPTSASPTDVAAGDVDGDGYLDLVVAAPSNSKLSVLRGQGAGLFATKQDLTTGDGPQSVALADLNQDGMVDLVSANTIGNSVSVLLNLGNDTFRAAIDFASGPSSNDVAIADFDADGKLDLVTSNGGNGSISFLKGQGDGNFDTAAETVVGEAVAGLVTGDFNGDAKLDVATANLADSSPPDGYFAVITGMGNGNFNSAVRYSLGPDAIVGGIAVGDYNGDARLDISVIESSQNKVDLWFGQ